MDSSHPCMPWDFPQVGCKEIEEIPQTKGFIYNWEQIHLVYNVCYLQQSNDE